MNEQQLIRAIKSGSEEGYRTLVSSYQNKVLNTCLGFVPNIQDAEDLCQEVFVQVFRSIDQFREDATLSTWIYRISISKCLEFIRHKKRKKRISFFQSLVGLEEAKDKIASPIFDHPGVQLERKEETRILFEQINQLPKNQKIAFTLHKIEHMSHKEIGDILNTSVSAVESLIFRAKRRLRSKLTKLYYEKEG